ncbi:MAG: nucleotidyltransferase domain-containing protein [Candidatus Dormibacteria bacterium]
MAERLRDVSVPWCIAAGWALDLFRGAETRVHEDTEIAVPWRGFPAIREALAGFEFDVVGFDESERYWPVDSPAFDVTHQTWVREPGTSVYRLDVFREPHDGEVWICRRDEDIRLKYDEIIHRTADGIPFLAPEIVLLFKAKAAREKDDQDLEGTLPLLGTARRRWLREALGSIYPGHRWVDLL